MFPPSELPRVIGVPPGADFPRVLLESILHRMRNHSPESLARVRIIVATRRMQRRLVEMFQDGPARLLPGIEVVTDVTRLMPGAHLPAPVSTLRRCRSDRQLGKAA